MTAIDNTFHQPNMINCFYFENGAVANKVTVFEHKDHGERIVFVPNWNAKQKHWIEFVLTLNKHYRVEYFESREKASTQFKDEQFDFSLNQMAQDVANYLNKHNQPYHLIGTSLGCTYILKAWEQIEQKPKSLTLICPVINLKLPLYFKLIPHIPEKMVKWVAPFAYYILKRTNQMKDVARVLNKTFKENDFSGLRLLQSSVKHLLKLKFDQTLLNNIKCPSLVFYAQSDKIHSKSDAEIVANALNTKQPVRFPDFRSVHKKTAANAILDWLNKS